MRRKVSIAGAVVLVIILVIAGIGYMAISDEHSAMDELEALQSQILDIGKEAQGNPSLEQLKRMSVQLSDIRSELFDVSSNHRLGSMFFSSIQTDVDEVIDTEQNLLTQINLKIGSR
jgi:hypothetical protein